MIQSSGQLGRIKFPNKLAITKQPSKWQQFPKLSPVFKSITSMSFPRFQIGVYSKGCKPFYSNGSSYKSFKFCRLAEERKLPASSRLEPSFRPIMFLLKSMLGQHNDPATSSWDREIQSSAETSTIATLRGPLGGKCPDSNRAGDTAHPTFSMSSASAPASRKWYSKSICKTTGNYQMST